MASKIENFRLYDYLVQDPLKENYPVNKACERENQQNFKLIKKLYFKEKYEYQSALKNFQTDYQRCYNSYILRPLGIATEELDHNQGFNVYVLYDWLKSNLADQIEQRRKDNLDYFSTVRSIFSYLLFHNNLKLLLIIQ